MAEPYKTKLQSIVDHYLEHQDDHVMIECKHFFSGAALYVNGTICVSWSPVGLAFKLPEAESNKLINSGRAKHLKYFLKGNIKKGYALFEKPDISKPQRWKIFFLKAVAKTLSVFL